MKNRNLCLHQIFESVAESCPGKTALVGDGVRLSYRELDEHAGKIAMALSGRVKLPGQLVAVMMERSAELVAAILGILKAGGAFLPISSDLPAESIREIIADSGVTTVVTARTNGIASALPVTVVTVEEALRGSAPPAGHVSSVSPQLTDAAYVIYTSGSTGQPKGVVVEHGNVTRLFECGQQLFDFGADKVWSVFHSFSFDFSVWELWGALLHGGTAVLVPKAMAAKSAQVARLVEEQRVTMLSLTPSNFGLFAKAAIAEGCRFPFLQTVVLGGERVTLSHLRQWYSHYGDAITIVNMYGITETTVHVTYKRLGKDSVLADMPISIGQPLPDLTAYLLDEKGTPVPEGETGEIVVAGPGVARGYLNRPALTEERFPKLPLGPGHELVRVYRSGDLGCRKGDELFYRGRKDDQVKVRGYRIELAEVEAKLAQMDGIEACAVVKQQLDEMDSRLVAFVVPATAGWRGADAAMRALVDVLPSYMRPSMILEVPGIPVTSNGKTDRAALLQLINGFHGVEHPASGSGEEDVIATIAGLGRATLNVPSLSIHEDLFDQGATSLSIVRLLLAVNSRFGTQFTGVELDGDITIANMANLVLTLNGHSATATAAGNGVQDLQTIPMNK